MIFFKIEMNKLNSFKMFAKNIETSHIYIPVAAMYEIDPILCQTFLQLKWIQGLLRFLVSLKPTYNYKTQIKIRSNERQTAE